MSSLCCFLPTESGTDLLQMTTKEAVDESHRDVQTLIQAGYGEAESISALIVKTLKLQKHISHYSEFLVKSDMFGGFIHLRNT